MLLLPCELSNRDKIFEVILSPLNLLFLEYFTSLIRVFIHSINMALELSMDTLSLISIFVAFISSSKIKVCC